MEIVEACVIFLFHYKNKNSSLEKESFISYFHC